MTNTTNSVQGVPRGVVEGVEDDATYQRRVTNTSDIYELPPQGTMIVEDEEPEVVHVLPGDGWHALFEDGHHEPLVCWVVMDHGGTYGVVPQEDGTIDVNKSAFSKEGFKRYERINNG